MTLDAREVQKIYIAYFGRPADPAGLKYWQAQANSAQVANGFSQAAEYQSLYASDNPSFLISNIYQNLFGRSPEPEGLAFWVKELSDGNLQSGAAALAILQAASGSDASLLKAKLDAAEAFTATLSLTTLSAAYKGYGPAADARMAWAAITSAATVPTDFRPLIDKMETHWVDGVQKIYVAYFGRPADPAGLDFWVERAISLRADWIRVAEEFSAFPEARELYGSDTSLELINAIYLNVLGREPDAAGRDYWLARLDEGSISAGAMALAVANSTRGADTITHGQRIDAAKAFTLQLETDKRDDDYTGATVTAVAREWLYGIGPDADDLTAALQVMPDLVNAFVGGELRGIVVNGYIAGATVFVDSDGDGQLDPDEVRVVSDAAGNFVFPVGRPSGAVIAVGGTNITTGQPNEAILKAPSGSAVVTPLSTLVQLMIENDLGVTQEDAENLLFAALGIPKVDLSYFDPVKYGLTGTAEQKAVALQIEAVTTQVANTLAIGSALLQGVGVSPALARDSVLNMLVASIAAGPVDLAQPASLQAVLQAAVAQAAPGSAAVAQATAAVGGVVSVLSEINTRIDRAAGAFSSGLVDDPVGVLSDMFKLATLVQSELTRDVKQSTADGTGRALATEYTGTNLTRNVDEVVAGDIVPGTPTDDGTTITNGGTPGAFAVIILAGEDDRISSAEATVTAALTAVVSSGTLSTIRISGVRKTDGTALDLSAVYNAATNRYEFDATQFRDGLLQVAATGSRGQIVASTLTLDSAVPRTPEIRAVTDDVAPITGTRPDGGVTNDVTPTIRVGLTEASALAGGAVQLYDGLTPIGDKVTLAAANIAAGYVDITTPPLVNGETYDFRVAATSATGNRSELSATGEFNLTIDTTAPTTQLSGIDISDDTGSSASDFITRIAAQTVTATLSSSLAAGEGLFGSVDNGANWAEITGQVSGRAVSWTGVTLAGSSSIKLEVRDAAGNAGPVASQSYQIGPAAGIRGIDISDDTGESDTDFITGIAGQMVSATIDAGLGVNEQLFGSVDNGSTWVRITDLVQGTVLNWSGVVLAGTSTIKLEVRDAAGNIDATAAQAYTLDTTAPGVSGIDINADTGSSQSDFITRTASQTVTATLDAPLTADEGLLGSADNGATWALINDKVSGTAVSWTGVTLSGASSIKLEVRDAAGNIGPAATQAYVLDITAPTTAVSGIDISADTGASETDFITRTAAQTVTATLGAPLAAGEQLYGSVDNGATWTEITDQVSGTAVTWTGVTLAGASSIKLEVRDAAGNIGPAATQAYVLDTTAPTTAVSAIDISADTGASQTDFITRTAAQTVTATLGGTLAAGEQLYGSVDNGATWTEITGQVSGTAVTWTGVTLSGASSIRLEVRDAAGNIGPAATQAYTLDTTAPSAVSAIDISADTGASETDFITRTAAQTVTATLGAPLAAGEQLYGSVDNGATWTEITDQVSGTAVTWTGVTLAGASSIKLEVRDAAGNAGPAATQAYTLDTTAPAGPTITQVAVDDTPALVTDGGTTGDSTPTLRVSLAAGAAIGDSVQLYDDVVALGDKVVLTAENIAAGYIDITPAPLVVGVTYNFRAAMTDIAGNIGTLSATNAFDITIATSQVFTITERYTDGTPDLLRVDMGVNEAFTVVRDLAGLITGYRFTDAGVNSLPDTDPVVAAFLGSEKSLAPSERTAIEALGVVVTYGGYGVPPTYTVGGNPASPEQIAQVQSLDSYRGGFYDQALGAYRSFTENPGLVTNFDKIEVRSDGTYVVGVEGQYSVFELRAGAPLTPLSTVKLVPQIVGDFRADAEGAFVLFEAESDFADAFPGLESIAIETPIASYLSLDANVAEDFMLDIRSIKVRVTGEEGVMARVSLSARNDRINDLASRRFMDFLESIEIIADIKGQVDMSLSSDGVDYFMQSLKTIRMIGKGQGYDRVNLSVSADTNYNLGTNGEWEGVQNNYYMRSLESITMISDTGEADLSITMNGGDFFMESLKTIYLEGGFIWLEMSVDANFESVSDDFMKSLESIVIQVNEAPRSDPVQRTAVGSVKFEIDSDGGNRFMSSLEQIDVNNSYGDVEIELGNDRGVTSWSGDPLRPNGDEFMKKLDRVVVVAPSGYAQIDIDNNAGVGGLAGLRLVDVDAMNAYVRLSGVVARDAGSVTIDVSKVDGAKGSGLFGDIIGSAFVLKDYESLSYIRTHGVIFNDNSTAEIIINIGSSDLQYNAIYKIPGTYSSGGDNVMFATIANIYTVNPEEIFDDRYVPLKPDGSPALDGDGAPVVVAGTLAEKIEVPGDFTGLIGTKAGDISAADDYQYFDWVLPVGWNSMGENDVPDRFVFTTSDLGRIVIGGFEHGLDRFDFSDNRFLPLMTGQVLDASHQAFHVATAAGGILVTQVAGTSDAKIWLNTEGDSTVGFDDFESSIYLVGGASQAWGADDFIFASAVI